MKRRHFLQLSTAFAGTSVLAPRIAFAQAGATDKRFVFIIQRGAADGLSTLMPLGDPAFEAVREELSEPAGRGREISSLFSLHPSLEQCAMLFGQGDAIFAHALASNYRDRSHFDGQNLLETGGAEPYRLRDGWLNRLIQLMPADDFNALALANAMPAVLRGDAEASSYSPSRLPDTGADLEQRVSMLYDNSPELHSLWEQAIETDELAGDVGGRLNNGRETGEMAARLLSADNGARVMTIETGGWDTHANQNGRIARALTQIDNLLGTLREGLSSYWRDTLVVVATEFGRTVRPNGTGGTDHGTGSAAMLFGGGIRGGRIIADWPGLAPQQLFDGRDLRPTGSLEGLIAGAVSEHFALDPDRVRQAVFPAIGQDAFFTGLIGAR